MSRAGRPGAVLRTMILPLLAAGSLLRPAPLSPQKTPPPADSPRQMSRDRSVAGHQPQALYQGIVDAYVRKGLPGMVLLVKTPAEGTWTGTGGFARLEDRSPMRADTVFHALGLTRLFLATAVMMLRDEGRIDLDASIDRYLPAGVASRVANSRSATVRHLLAFVSGIPEHSVEVPPWNDPRLDLDWYDKLSEVFDEPSLFDPGSEFHFCNTDGKLLAMIVDGVTGSHVDFFRARIVDPLGLERTYYKSEPGLPHLPSMADAYFDRYGDGAVENIGPDMRLQVFRKGYGDAGLFSTVGDIARFLEALFGGELVTAGSLRLMTAVAFPGCHPNVGLGFKIYEHFADQALYGPACWNGGWGHSAWFDFYVFPRAGVIIGWGANLSAANVDGAGVFEYFDIIEDVAAAVFR